MNKTLVRVEMISNYDCINSHYYECLCGGYSYNGESYFSDMVDFLNLNPVKVYKALSGYLDDNYLDTESFVDMPGRNGREYVDYKKFAEEIINSTSPVNLLTFIGFINSDDIENIKEVKIPEGAVCGLFSSMEGGGSAMGMKLKRDLEHTAKNLKENNWQPTLYVYKDKKYSISDVYGSTLGAEQFEIEAIR